MIDDKKLRMTAYANVNDINRTNFIESGNTSQTSHADGANKKMKIDTYHDFHTMLGKVDLHVKPKFTYNSGDNTTLTTASESRIGEITDSDATALSASDAKNLLINDSRNLASTLSHNYTAGISATGSVKFDHNRNTASAAPIREATSTAPTPTRRTTIEATAN